jgi:DNA-binding NtrC family response regulator
MAPLSNMPLGNPTSEGSKESSEVSDPEGMQPSIYVVDDEPMVGEVIDIILRLESFETRLFQDPVKALVAFTAAHHRPSLLISDFAMRPINGMELITECLRLQPGLRTILISSNVGEDIIENYEAKPDAFISKPFQPKPFVHLIRTILEESKSIPLPSPAPMRTLIWQP